MTEFYDFPDHEDVIEEDSWDEYFDEWPVCGCEDCFCMNHTEYGEKCNDCILGAHQG